MKQEPLIKPHEYERAKAITAANHKKDATDQAADKLALLRFMEPIWKARIDAAFEGMDEAQAEYRRQLNEESRND